MKNSSFLYLVLIYIISNVLLSSCSGNKPTKPQPPQDGNQIVYRTPKGKKFHNKDCKSLKRSKKVLSIPVRDAKSQSLEPCELCFDNSYVYTEISDNVEIETFRNNAINQKGVNKIYDILEPDYEVGDRETFGDWLKDENHRKITWKALSDYFEMNEDYDEFWSRMGYLSSSEDKRNAFSILDQIEEAIQKVDYLLEENEGKHEYDLNLIKDALESAYMEIEEASYEDYSAL